MLPSLPDFLPSLDAFIEPFAISTGVVALAEIGDKTQLLAFLLAARFKKPLPIVAGIFVATVLNHALAGALGAWITTAVSPQVLRWVLGLSFIAMAVWTLIPTRSKTTRPRWPSASGCSAPRC
jgi:putative Ca2+/H+ antiporter (TMEM165/GDT1 family)